MPLDKETEHFSWAPLYELLSAAFLPLVAALAAYTSCIFSVFTVLVYCSAHSESSTITIQMPVTTVLRGDSDTSFALCCCPQGAVLPSVGQVPAFPTVSTKNRGFAAVHPSAVRNKFVYRGMTL